MSASRIIFAVCGGDESFEKPEPGQRTAGRGGKRECRGPVRRVEPAQKKSENSCVAMAGYGGTWGRTGHSMCKEEEPINNKGAKTLNEQRNEIAAVPRTRGIPERGALTGPAGRIRHPFKPGLTKG